MTIASHGAFGRTGLVCWSTVNRQPLQVSHVRFTGGAKNLREDVQPHGVGKQRAGRFVLLFVSRDPAFDPSTRAARGPFGGQQFRQRRLRMVSGRHPSLFACPPSGIAGSVLEYHDLVVSLR